MDVPPPLPPLAPRTSFATVLAFLGLLAAAAGWFLPWTGKLDLTGAGFTRGDLERLVERGPREGVSEAVVGVATRVLAADAVTGRDLSIVFDHWFDTERATLEEKEVRGWTVGLAALRWSPWALLGAAGLLLLGLLRKPSAFVGALVLVLALLVACFVAIVGLGASESARAAVRADPATLGVGAWAIAGGALAALVGGVFAVRTSTWWKVYLLAIGGVVAAIVGVARYVDV